MHTDETLRILLEEQPPELVDMHLCFLADALTRTERRELFGRGVSSTFTVSGLRRSILPKMSVHLMDQTYVGHIYSCVLLCLFTCLKVQKLCQDVTTMARLLHVKVPSVGFYSFANITELVAHPYLIDLSNTPALMYLRLDRITLHIDPRPSHCARTMDIVTQWKQEEHLKELHLIARRAWWPDRVSLFTPIHPSPA